MTATLTGELDACDRDGRARVRSSGPLELRGPLSASQLYYLRNVTAGIFEGDVYRMSIVCPPEARARIESSSATKVYRMLSGCATAGVKLSAAPHSTLVWGPHSTILQAGSALRQETHVVLHEGACVLMAETLVMGRIAAGQRFDFASFESTLVVEGDNGDARYREAYELLPGPDLEAAMDGFGVLTTVYALGAFEPDKEQLDGLCAAHPLTGWSTLPGKCGLVVKAIAASLSEGTAIARAALAVFEASREE